MHYLPLDQLTEDFAHISDFSQEELERFNQFTSLIQKDFSYSVVCFNEKYLLFEIGNSKEDFFKLVIDQDQVRKAVRRADYFKSFIGIVEGELIDGKRLYLGKKSRCYSIDFPKGWPISY